MLMTEEEARDVWCPLSRDVLGAGGNRLRYGYAADEKGSVPEYALEMAGQFPCIGTSCAAWRWVPPSGGESVLEAIRRHRAEHGSSLAEAKAFVESTPSYRRAPGPTVGYCGAFGKPEV